MDTLFNVDLTIRTLTIINTFRDDIIEPNSKEERTTVQENNISLGVRLG